MRKQKAQIAFSMRAQAVSLGVAAFLLSSAANATPNVNNIVTNIGISTNWLPGLLTALAYALGILFGVQAILKIKEHVDSPQHTPLRAGLIRLLAGGALFSLPMIYSAMQVTIMGDPILAGWADFVLGFIFGGAGVMSACTGVAANFNGILTNIICSISNFPGLVTAVGYMLGIVMGVSGILKIKEHVENPEQTALREGVIRFLIGGALFSLPPIFTVMKNTIMGGGGISGLISFLMGGSGVGTGGATAATDCVAGVSTAGGSGVGTVGQVICNTYGSSLGMPEFLIGASYVFGIVLAVWGLLKIKDHVLNPQQTPVWEAVARLIAGGAFFALPYVIEVMANTIDGGGGLANFGIRGSGFNGAATGSGLDAMLDRLMVNIYSPSLFVINWFGYIAGSVLIMVGISRLLKSAQEGPRGPGGIGTMMTFLMAAALISISPMIEAFSGSLFDGSQALVGSKMGYTTGLGTTEEDHIYAVFSAILKFMIILGAISFVRGLFIIREVAEGSSQASMMAGITHILGGALAINLGPVMNAVQTTLGLTSYGVLFN